MSEYYPAGQLEHLLHGIDYQKLWLMLFFRRAVDRKYFFRLATEMSSATGFDDIVFQHEQNGTTVYMLIQVKHKQDGNRKICISDLLTESGELNLAQHFAAFLKIQGDEEFKDKIKDFFIVINADFDHESLASKGVTVEKIETQDEFLNIGNSVRYKLRDLSNSIVQYLKQGMSAEGREVSDEEIKGFLNELVFVVNLPNGVELEKLIGDEIRGNLARKFKYFGDDDFVFNALSTMMSNWMKDKRGRFLTPEEGEKSFEKIEQFPRTLSGMKESLDEISNSHKGTEETMKEIYKLLCENSETLNGIYVAVTARDNKQRSHKKPHASHDKKTKAKEEGNIGELDEFDEIEALEFVKSALNIENNLQNKEIKKLAQKLQYSRLALKLAVTYISEENIGFSCRGRKGIRVGDYLKKCEKIAENLLDFKSKYKSDCFAKATFTTWKITINTIKQKKFGPEALGILVIMAYLDSNDICIEEIFSKAIAEDEKRVWNAVKLLDRYSIINLREGIVINIHKLVQKVIIRLTLQEKGREEKILRTALKLINSSSITQCSIRHVASVWRYASQYGKLIDDFYFTCGEQKYTPLRLLDESGDYEAIRRILTHMEGKYLDRSNRVVNARYKRELDIVRYLVEKGANVDAKDKNGNTPLHFAAIMGRVDIAKILLKHNADVNAENNEGRTALYYAAKYNHRELVELLLAHGAVPMPY